MLQSLTPDDMQHAGMLKDASLVGATAPASLNGAIPVSVVVDDTEHEGWIQRRQRENEAKGEGSKEAGPLESPQSLDLRRCSSRGSNLSGVSGNVHSETTSTVDSTVPNPAPAGRSRKDSTGTASRHRSPSSLLPSPARPVTGRDRLVVSARGSKSLVSNVDAQPSSPLSASLSVSDDLANAKRTAKKTVKPSSAVESAASRATVSSLLDQLTEIHDRQQSERLVEWDSFLRKHAKSTASADGKTADARAGVGIFGPGGQSLKAEDYKAFRRLVRKGIPLSYRSELWAECSGAKEFAVPGEYSEILVTHAGETSPVLTEIEKDVGRTFPGNVFFGGDGPGVAKLRRVLIAYSW